MSDPSPSHRSLETFISQPPSFDPHEFDAFIRFKPNVAMTHIIYRLGAEIVDNGAPRYIKLNPYIPEELYLPLNFAICSSCRGILLLYKYNPPTHAYFLFNPFADNSHINPLPPSPRQHPLSSCIPILAITLESVGVAFLMGPYEQEPIDETSPACTLYEVDVFSSKTDTWRSSKIGIFKRTHIHPTTYVSCHQNVFFLVVTDSEPSMAEFVTDGKPSMAVSLIRVDTETGELSSVQLPRSDAPIEARKVQLGRIGELLGIVIVKDITIEIYVLRGTQWQEYCVVNVVMDPESAEVDFYVLGDLSISCREMPTPMRFESFKLQLPLAVDGMIVMLESSNEYNLTSRFRFEILGEFPLSRDRLIRALPYVGSDMRIRYQVVVDVGEEQDLSQLCFDY